MKSMKTTVCSVILIFVAILFTTKAEGFDPEAISQVSKGIVEWKLMNEDKEQSQSEQTVYVSNSLKGIIKKGDHERIIVLQGLAAFDNNYRIESQINQWETNNRVNMSNDYISRLPTNPSVDVAGDISMKGVGIASQLWQKPSIIYGIESSVIGAGITFVQTIDSVGTSVQIMNPPIYLDEKTSWGWKGEGSYPIPGGHVSYHETLDTSASRWWEQGNITRTHTDLATTKMGTYRRHVEIKTPATSLFERFMMHHFPTGGSFDFNETTITTTTKINQSYRIESKGGIQKVTPLPSSGIGIGGSGEIGSNWSAPPKMPTYTPPPMPKISNITLTMPSSPWR